MNPFSLDGRTALVTGSARGLGLEMACGLGLEMARGLAQAGARVVLNGRGPDALGQANPPRLYPRSDSSAGSITAYGTNPRIAALSLTESPWLPVGKGSVATGFFPPRTDVPFEPAIRSGTRGCDGLPQLGRWDWPS